MFSLIALLLTYRRETGALATAESAKPPRVADNDGIMPAHAKAA